jgi:hypothetical protein
MRIPRAVIKAYLRRGAGIWLLMRLCISAVAAFGNEDPLHLAPTTIATLLAGGAALMWIDIRRRHERLLIGNLGFKPGALSCLALIPAAAGEIVLRIFATGLR